MNSEELISIIINLAKIIGCILLIFVMIRTVVGIFQITSPKKSGSFELDFSNKKADVSIKNDSGFFQHFFKNKSGK